MESFLLTVMIGAVVLILRNLQRSERTGDGEDLGLFSYVKERKALPEPEGGRRDA